MAAILDLSKKKPTLSVKLPDETLIRIYTPTKGVLEEFVNLMADIDAGANDADVLTKMYSMSAQIMSRNAGGRTITAKAVEEMLDYGDLIVFFKAYTNFVKELASEKN